MVFYLVDATEAILFGYSVRFNPYAGFGLLAVITLIVADDDDRVSNRIHAALAGRSMEHKGGCDHAHS
ncbi:MAG: hypothetical protein M2R45_01434 [Verrucomicrobia subdivision 3 bacterium]|nr:hypothetical protein [Limisphaerales bacterium]MCS1417620.1 hypothetical protein [Limisphaerales bacterium]